MGLFDKKFCDICGEKIGLLGNRKLDDGNLCGSCAKKLSPFTSDRRHSTVETIRQHLAYREQNKQSVAAFRPTKVIGTRKKVYIDEAAGKFIVTSSNSWQNENPDVIDISQVSRCDLRIDEHKREIYRTTKDGKRESYYPPRYECTYEFTIDIGINSPWFSQITFELSDRRPDSQFTDYYRELERQGHELCDILLRRGYGVQNAVYGGAAYPGQGNFAGQAPSYGQAAPAAYAAAVPSPAPAAAASGVWVCACGAQNTGNFCTQCASPRPQARPASYRCDKCGWVPDDPANPPKFCPQCGDPFTAEDLT